VIDRLELRGAEHLHAVTARQAGIVDQEEVRRIGEHAVQPAEEGLAAWCQVKGRRRLGAPDEEEQEAQHHSTHRFELRRPESTGRSPNAHRWRRRETAERGGPILASMAVYLPPPAPPAFIEHVSLPSPPLPAIRVSATDSFELVAATRPQAPQPVQVTFSNARGAYFRKVSSLPDASATGIAGTITLPSPTFDASRDYLSPAGLDDFRTGPLDRPAVYMGGNAQGHEIDAGLTWDRVYDAEGRATYTDLENGTDDGDPAHRFSREIQGGRLVLLDGTGQVVARGADAESRFAALSPNFAFRIFWRTNNPGQTHDWNNPAITSPQNLYFYPGQAVRMEVRGVRQDQLSLSIRRADDTAAPAFSQTIYQVGFGRGAPQSFKRVNSIDQFYVDGSGARRGREGQNVLATDTEALGAIWHTVSIERSDGGTTPMSGPAYQEVRGADTAAIYGTIFRVSGPTQLGGENLDITPPAPVDP
jgi:hypothetical protein